MAHSWNVDRATDHIEKKLADVKEVTIADYVRDMSLEKIPTNKAYRVDGVHLYADILNIGDMLNVTDIEGEQCHKKTLRFLDLHYRAVGRILSTADAIRVDFHNQRLHAVIAKPYNTDEDAEAKRIRRAIAIGQLIIDVLKKTGDDDESIPSAKVRIGIDSGKTLAVNNGRNGYREPLFLGNAANEGAKLSGGGAAEGIFLSNNARKAIGVVEVVNPKTIALTAAEVKDAQDKASLGITVDSVVDEWKEDLKNHPIGNFSFTRHTPPLRGLDIESLTPANSRRQEAVSIYADIDGFTAYVAKHIDDNAEDVVKTLHVLRAELERVLTTEFSGRRIRFIGDCVHGLVCEGTAQTTDIEESISTATLCAGGLRSSFDLAISTLEDNGVEVGELGLAIGFEYGWMTVTRLGKHGDRVRCSISRGVLRSEEAQLRCDGVETAIGKSAYDEGTDAVRKLFGTSRKGKDLDYNEVTEALSDSGDKTANESKAEAFTLAAPAIAKASVKEVTPHLSK